MRTTGLESRVGAPPPPRRVTFTSPSAPYAPRASLSFCGSFPSPHLPGSLSLCGFLDERGWHLSLGSDLFFQPELKDRAVNGGPIAGNILELFSPPTNPSPPPRCHSRSGNAGDARVPSTVKSFPQGRTYVYVCLHVETRLPTTPHTNMRLYVYTVSAYVHVGVCALMCVRVCVCLNIRNPWASGGASRFSWEICFHLIDTGRLVRWCWSASDTRWTESADK